MVSDRIEEAVPPEYAELLGITTLVCTPLSAAGRAYGVICADRGGGRFEFSDGERHLLWTLGKTAALVATARNVTRHQERTRRLGERLDLAREIHERVLQRLFGVSLALSAEQPLDRAERDRCRIEMQEALADLRRALERPLAPLSPETGTTLAAELERICARRGCRRGRLAGRVLGPRRSRAAGPVGAHRGAAQHRQARRPQRGSRSRGARPGHVHARAPQRRRPRRARAGAGDGPSPGRVRGAPAGRGGGVRAVRADGGASGWRCRWSAEDADRSNPATASRLAGPQAPCWLWTITTSSTGAFACCSASSRGSSASWRRARARRRSR